MFYSLTELTLIMLGQIPPNPGTTLKPGEKPAAPGEAPAEDGKKTVAPGETPGVKGEVSKPSGQPSPTTHQLADSTFYVLDPNKPKELTLGKTVKENLLLASQFNTLQSKHHLTTNRNEELEKENVQLKAQAKATEDSNFLTNKLTEMGIVVQDKPMAPPGAAPTGPPVTPGVPTAEQIAAAQLGVEQTDAWGNPIVPVVQPVQPGPTTPQPIVISSETLPLLVAALKEALQPDLQGMLGDLKSQASQQDQERSLKDQTTRHFSDVFDSKIDGLVDNGVDRIEATRIASIEQEAREAERQAEELFKVVGPQRGAAIESATVLMNQSERLRNDAAVARSTATTLAATEKIKQDAIELLEEDSYVGVDQSKLLSGDPNEVRKYTDDDVAATNKNNLETAIKIAEESERVRRTAGVL